MLKDSRALRLSRQQLYEIVWSEPLKTLSARFGISDVGLKKTCARAEIPTPDRGYWAKKEAGKKTFEPELPPRPPGMDDEVLVGGGNSYYGYQAWDNQDLLGPLPPLPEFHEPIETVCERIAKVVGNVTVPHHVRIWHPTIDRLLKEDDRRREKQRASSYQFSWESPKFDAPIDRRRLRILNSLFFAAARMNGKPAIYLREVLESRVSFHQQDVSITLDRPRRSSGRGHTSTVQQGTDDTRLCLSILRNSDSEAVRMTWQDDDMGRLETHVTQIAIQLILTAEVQYRERAVNHDEWRVKRKAELEEEEKQRKLAAERAERERLKRIEQARIDRLLKDAAAFQQANEIRHYVEAIRLAQSCDQAHSTEDLEQWRRWALAQADRIDPAIGGAYLKAMQDEGEARK